MLIFRTLSSLSAQLQGASLDNADLQSASLARSFRALRSMTRSFRAHGGRRSFRARRSQTLSFRAHNSLTKSSKGLRLATPRFRGSPWTTPSFKERRWLARSFRARHYRRHVWRRPIFRVRFSGAPMVPVNGFSSVDLPKVTAVTFPDAPETWSPSWRDEMERFNLWTRKHYWTCDDDGIASGCGDDGDDGIEHREGMELA